MARCFAMFCMLTAIGLTAAAHGQSTPNGQPPDYAPVVLRVACGGVFNAACTKALPRIAAQTVHAGLVLKPKPRYRGSEGRPL